MGFFTAFFSATTPWQPDLGRLGKEKLDARTLLYGMEADNWIAQSGIDIRQLVWSLLRLAQAYEPKNSDEDGAVRMLIVDGE